MDETQPDMHELGHCTCPYVTGAPVGIKDALGKERALCQETGNLSVNSSLRLTLSRSGLAELHITNVMEWLNENSKCSRILVQLFQK